MFIPTYLLNLFLKTKLTDSFNKNVYFNYTFFSSKYLCT